MSLACPRSSAIMARSEIRQRKRYTRMKGHLGDRAFARDFLPFRDFMATFPLSDRLKRFRILDSLGSVSFPGFRLVNDAMKAPHFSSVELKVQGIARRNANHQLLRVPWGRFRRAYDEYPRWHALALWGEIVLGTGPRGHSSLLATLKKHCPCFVAGRSRLQQSEPLALNLLEWVHTQRFGYAKQECWLDALTFYGVRHPLSRGAWAYWENCEAERNRKRVVSVPTFERWWRSALQWPLCEEAACAAVAAEVKRYLDWEVLMLWLRPLFFSSIGLPPHALSELNRRCPDISNLNDSTALWGPETRSSMWRRVVKAGNHHFLSQARQEGWLSNLLEQVRSHPWHVRMHAYAARWKQECSRSPVPPYPSLRQWKLAAAQYISSGPVSYSVVRCSPNASPHIS